MSSIVNFRPFGTTPLDALHDLVSALNATHWSSWQTTASFRPALQVAEQVIKHERAKAVGPELLEALEAVVNAWDALHASTRYVPGVGDRQEDLEFREMQAARIAIAKVTGSEA